VGYRSGCGAVVDNFYLERGMTDRELLELSANAAGIEYTGESYARNAIGGGHYENYPWNPLTDDGDALRLAVKLDIEITLFAIHFPVNHTYYTLEFNYEDGEDKYAATRRAIVRAAAEIGKGMK